MAGSATGNGEWSGRKVEEFHREEYLGHGSFCEVVRCRDGVTGKKYAMKSVVKRRGPQDQAIAMEVHCLRARLQGSPWVAALLLEEDSPVEWIGIFELCDGGELWEYIKHCGCCLPGESAAFVSQMVHALAAVHDVGIVHRDVKCENFMLTADRSLKLIDFGTARDTEHPEVQTMKLGPQHEHHVGTPNFMAPEAVHGKANDRRSDLWSLGCTVYQLMLGAPPFGAVTPFLVLTKAQAGNLWLPDRGLPAPALDLIRRLVVLEPERRLGAVAPDGSDGGAATRQVLAHGFLRDAEPRGPPDTPAAVILRHLGRAAAGEAEAMINDPDRKDAKANADESAFLFVGGAVAAPSAQKPGEAIMAMLRDVNRDFGDEYLDPEPSALFRMARDCAAAVKVAHKPESFARRLVEASSDETDLTGDSLMALGRFLEMAEQAVREAEEPTVFDGGSDCDSEDKEDEGDEEETPTSAARGALEPTPRRCCGFLW